MRVEFNIGERDIPIPRETNKVNLKDFVYLFVRARSGRSHLNKKYLRSFLAFKKAQGKKEDKLYDTKYIKEFKDYIGVNITEFGFEKLSEKLR